MDDQDPGGALHRADLVLVRPSPVIRHRPAAKYLLIQLAGIGRIGYRRIVYEHHERLAFHVDTLVVVPVVFRRDNAVADEDKLGFVEAGDVGHVFRPRDDIVFPLESVLLLPFCEHERRGRRRDADERHLLNVRPVGVAGLQADLHELIDEIVHRQLFAFRAGRTTFELVGGEHLRMRQHGGRVDVGQLRDRNSSGLRAAGGSRQHQRHQQRRALVHVAHSCILCTA